MSRITTALEHVVTLLKASPAFTTVQGRVFQGAAPEGAKHPLILIQTYGDALDVTGLGAVSPATRPEILIRVVGPQSLSTLEGIHDDVCDALAGTFGTNSRGVVASCTRVSESEMTEPSDAGVIRYLGSRWRLLVT